jgi:RsiW-degrading membrane proteinase PrsW (M82 family)
MIRRFFSIVPKAVQRGASVAAGCTLLIGLVAGYKTADQGDMLRTMSVDTAAALVTGVAVATWLLCLGFVFADARRRAMRPVLWVLVAALFPHLLGFLLYFVMRQPIPSTCTHCGGTIPQHQRFCSWCGAPQPSSPSSNARLTVDPC